MSLNIEQGLMSTVELVDGTNRIKKYINDLDAYDDPVILYAEYKILKYISKLSPFFPQNIQEHGPLIISYDYVLGHVLNNIVENLSVIDQWKIICQIVKLYIILAKVDIFHGDTNLKNFIIDANGYVHIIDFGLSYSLTRKIIGIPQNINISRKECNIISDEYHVPLEDYHDIVEIDYFINLLNEIISLLNTEKFNDEFIDVLSKCYQCKNIKDLEIIFC